MLVPLEVKEMQAIGGRTQWYCPSCGRAVSVGGACQYCGAGGIPEGLVDADAPGGIFAVVRRIVAGLLGRTGQSADRV